jgi:[ribosomal protein S18]-alanine N-acetyltransferase
MNRPTDDVDRIMAIMDAAFDPQFGEAWSYRQILDALTLGNCDYCLIDAEGYHSTPGDAVGFFLSRYGFEEEELLLLAVKPSARRMGFGNTLLKILAESAKNRGAKRLLLEMRRGNDAEALYRKFGFTPIGLRTSYYRTKFGNIFDAVTFSLSLD